eukprot:305041_1
MNDIYFDFTKIQTKINPTDTMIPFDTFVMHQYVIPQTYQFLFYSDSLKSSVIKKIIRLYKDNNTLTIDCFICNDQNDENQECLQCKNGFPIPTIKLIDDDINEIIVSFQFITPPNVTYLLQPKSQQLRFPIAQKCFVDFNVTNNIPMIAGQEMDIFHGFKFTNCMVLKNNEDIFFEFNVRSDELVIDVNVIIDASTGECITIHDQNNGFVRACEKGLFPTVTSLGKTEYTIHVSSVNDNSRIAYSSMTFQLQPCGYGEGVILNGTIFYCEECQINQFKLSSGFEECFNCIDSQISGIKCEGSYSLRINYNHWVSAVDEDLGFVDVTNISNKHTIFASVCAPQYCCQELDGCYYLDSNTKIINEKLCAIGRSATSPLCSSCEDNLYEVFGSSACSVCEEYNFGYLFIVCILSMLFTLCIFFVDATDINVKPYTQSEIIWKRIFIKDQLTAVKILLFRIIVYYFQ